MTLYRIELLADYWTYVAYINAETEEDALNKGKEVILNDYIENTEEQTTIEELEDDYGMFEVEEVIPGDHFYVNR